MAFAGKEIQNNVTGQRIRFVRVSQDTGGSLLEMIAVYHPASREPAIHYHPQQAEDFTVLEGGVTVRLDGVERILEAGDRIHIAKGKPHSMWNAGTVPAVVNWQVRPALDTEHMLETLTGLANDGKTDKNGLPSLLQLALTVPRFRRTIRLEKPPYILQRIIFGALGPVSRLLGNRAVYNAYLD